MEKFFIITNHDKNIDLKTIDLIIDLIKKHNKTCYVREKECRNTDDFTHDRFWYTNPESVPDDTDCVIVLGGDGTLILAARDLVNLDIPFIGVNFGNLGYLAEIEKQDIEDMITKLVNDNYHIESRMMLDGKILRDGNEVERNMALNDIVVGRSGSMRVIDFNIYVDGELLNQYTADGIIVSTPTGSTAYNLSAGGPIVEPGANIILLTPICPHTLNTRSIVLSANSQIEIEIGKDRRKDNKNEGKMVSFDGNTNISLATGDRVCVSKSRSDTKIAKIGNKSFVEILQKKMSTK